MISKLSILIPVYNEEKTIGAILQKVTAVFLPANIRRELVIVNDCSTDTTEEQINKFRMINPDTTVIYIAQEKNQGKGAAIRRAIQAATGDYCIVQDADLEYDPEEYVILLKPILDGYADVVFGSRFVGGKPHRMLFFLHTIGNRVLTFLSNILTNLNLSDMETCFKMFPTSVLKQLNLCENRFGFEPEITSKISRVPGIRIYEVGISYYGRSYEEGKKISWKDGFRAIFVILKYNIWKRK